MVKQNMKKSVVFAQITPLILIVLLYAIGYLISLVGPKYANSPLVGYIILAICVILPAVGLIIGLQNRKSLGGGSAILINSGTLFFLVLLIDALRKFSSTFR